MEMQKSTIGATQTDTIARYLEEWFKTIGEIHSSEVINLLLHFCLMSTARGNPTAAILLSVSPD
ncbi:hypothetical protein T03_99 [Trichinella britovi]|uniref:Uncharacterized protein n=1 Tax=Trichinella britovi TaxID=45882 RepID=A0A0V1CY40_TRIBR|nr:hypothetical protein T03_99 [Trichinella britovi]